jgi:hypothetical protein
MNRINENIEASKYAQQLKQECIDSIPHRRGKEILLLIYFLIIFTIIAVYLWVNTFIYDFWFYILLGLLCVKFLMGYLLDRRYHPDWKQYFLDILNEMKGVNTVKLADFINAGQPFLGANLGTCEKFLKIAEKFLEGQVTELVIRGANVYLKGFEPPPEEKKEKKEGSDEENAQGKNAQD